MRKVLQVSTRLCVGALAGWVGTAQADLVQSGTVQITGGGFNTIYQVGQQNGATPLSGSILINGGSFNGRSLLVGQGTGVFAAPGSVNITDGSLTLTQVLNLGSEGEITLNGGTLSHIGSDYTNFGQITVNSGFLRIGPGAANLGNLQVNGGTVVVSGSATFGGGNGFGFETTSTNATVDFTGLTTASGGARLRGGAKIDFRGLTTRDNLFQDFAFVSFDSNAGSSGGIRLGGDYVLSGGVLDLGGNDIQADQFVFDARFIHDGGRLTNVGEIDVPVFVSFDGTVAPGASPGLLTVDNDFDLEGTLEIELGGLTPVDYDRVAVAGQATIDGTVQLLSWEGFTPEVGDTFEILTAEGGLVLADDVQKIGDFNFDLAVVDQGASQALVATILPVPEPSSAMLLALSGLALARRRRG